MPRRFDAVVLASHLVNVPDDEVLAAFLACCERHVAPGGCVVIERFPERWFDQVTENSTERDGIGFHLSDVSRPAPDLVAARVECRIGERAWSQSFVTRRLDDASLRERLRDVGLRFDSALTEDGAWVLARPA